MVKTMRDTEIWRYLIGRPEKFEVIGKLYFINAKNRSFP